MPGGRKGKYVIPDGVSTIEKTMFGSCSNLASVTIPQSVTSIKEYAFGQCNALTTVYYLGTEEDYKKISIEASQGSHL